MTRLQTAYRMYRIRKEIRQYYTELVEKFKNVRDDPLFGRHVKWPKHGPILNDADTMLKRIFETWWARKMVGGLERQQRELWRVQLLAHKFFAGAKQVRGAAGPSRDLFLLQTSNPSSFAPFVRRGFR